MAIQAVDWFVPEHHLSMYWFKVLFLRGVSPRSTDLGTGWEVLRVLSAFDAWWHANNPLLGVQHVSTGGVKAAKQVGLSSLADGQKCSGSA